MSDTIRGSEIDEQPMREQQGHGEQQSRPRAEGEICEDSMGLTGNGTGGPQWDLAARRGAKEDNNRSV